jgi:hypothetical protein
MVTGLQVLEGYHYLGNVGSLGEEVMHGFAAAVNSAALRVVRTMALARARSGVEEKARGATILQEAVKLLPPDLFRQCLTQVWGRARSEGNLARLGFGG